MSTQNWKIAVIIYRAFTQIHQTLSKHCPLRLRATTFYNFGRVTTLVLRLVAFCSFLNQLVFRSKYSVLCKANLPEFLATCLTVLASDEFWRSVWSFLYPTFVNLALLKLKFLSVLTAFDLVEYFPAASVSNYVVVHHKLAFYVFVWKSLTKHTQGYSLINLQ